MNCGTDCGKRCGCAGIEVSTPLPTANPPGRDRLEMRVGTHGRFLESMSARMSGPAYPALRGLRTRSPSDPAIALADAAAVLGDLLTFYTERIGHEGYLRTATEERSLRLLGRLVGHEPRPGVGAGVHLAYTVDRDPRSGEDSPVRIPRGARAQSVPAPDPAGTGPEAAAGPSDPQSYETSEDLTARWSWNELAVRTRKPYQVGLRGDTGVVDRRSLYLAGAATTLEPGNRLLFVFGTEKGRQALEAVRQVEVDSRSDVTAVELPGPALAGFSELAGQFRALTGQAREHEMYGRSRIVRRYVEEVLVPVSDALPEPPDPGPEIAGMRSERVITTPTEFGRELDTALERLAEALELARPYENVHAYLTGLLAELTALRLRVALLEPPQDRPGPEGSGDADGGKEPEGSRPSAGARGTGSLYEVLALHGFAGGGTSVGEGLTGAAGVDQGGAPAADDPALLGLAALLGALRQSPARPPASARDLTLDPAKVFGPASDAGVQLLAALDPRLSNLYNAWGRVNLTAPPALAELQAMRVVATPFGASAPLRPAAFDANGRVTRYEDWPLTGSISIIAQVTYEDGAPVRLRLTYVEAGVPTPLEVELPVDPDAAPLPFGPGEARITTATSGEFEAVRVERVDVEYLGELPDLTVSIGAVSTGGTVTLTVEDGAPARSFQLESGQVETGAYGGFRVNARRSGPGESPATALLEVATSGTPLTRSVIALDSVYPGIGPGSWVAIERPDKGNAVPGNPELQRVITRVERSRVITREGFGITGKVTELALADDWLDGDDSSLAHIRNTTVYAKGEPLAVATEPILDDVAGGRIELAGLYDGLRPGRWIILTGERTDIPDTPGVRAAELSMIAGLEHDVAPPLPGDTVHSTLTLAAPLSYSYRRDTVTIYANVVRATQGAGHDEPIGSGDAARAGQSFRLFQGPLTWLPSAEAAHSRYGAKSTLEIRVDGVRWNEVDSLAGRGPTEQVYVTRTDDEGRTVVTFGDGVHGSRLPTGHENVRARYRVGLGKDGNVGADRITTPITRPLGVTAVTNPRPATGGANGDDVTQSRRQIPLSVTALDRLVSVQDYEDFARTRAGIGRALATRLFDPGGSVGAGGAGRETVHVTVAGVDDIPLDGGGGPGEGDLVSTLRSALVALGDPQLPVTVAVREPVLLVLSAGIRVAPAYAWEFVEPAVRAALTGRLGFAARELGQPAYLSEAITAAQAVPGVNYVDVDVFTGVPGGLSPAGLVDLAATLTEPLPVVPARRARHDETFYVVGAGSGRPVPESLTLVAAKNGITVAELLRLNPDITDVTPLPPGRRVRVFAGVRPAQLVMLSPAVPSTLILKEIR